MGIKMAFIDSFNDLASDNPVLISVIVVVLLVILVITLVRMRNIRQSITKKNAGYNKYLTKNDSLRASFRTVSDKRKFKNEKQIEMEKKLQQQKKQEEKNLHEERFNVESKE